MGIKREINQDEDVNVLGDMEIIIRCSKKYILLGLGLEVDLTQKNGRSIRRKPPKNSKKCLGEKNCKHCFYLVLD